MLNRNEKYKIISDHIEWIKEQNNKLLGVKIPEHVIDALGWAKHAIFHNGQYYKSILAECRDYQDLLKKAMAHIDDKLVRIEIQETIQHYIDIKRKWTNKKNGATDESSI